MDVNVPGVMAILVAPLVAQLSVMLELEFAASGTAAFMLPGEAANELIVGLEPFPVPDINGVVEPQPASKVQANRMKTRALRLRPKDLRSGYLGFLPQEELAELSAAWIPLFIVWPRTGDMHIGGQPRLSGVCCFFCSVFEPKTCDLQFASVKDERLMRTAFERRHFMKRRAESIYWGPQST